jgi:homoserine O-acetyltransferase
MDDYRTFDLGDFVLQSGETLRNAKLAYATWGELNAERSNAIVVPTAYGGTHRDNAWLVGADRALDPSRWFVVSPNLFGNGISSSPSNTPAPQSAAAFPNITIYDNVFAQKRLMAEVFGVERIALVTGFSMGALQTFAWGAAFGDAVERIAPYCGSARASEHNIVFLDGLRAALTTDKAWRNGRYTEPPFAGLEAMARTWAAWGLSQTWYREQTWRTFDAPSRDAYVKTNWVDAFAAGDANDLLCLLWTWRHADVGALPQFGGDTQRALAAITARALVMPASTDCYFPPEDSALEVAAMPNAELAIIESIWGHQAGANTNSADDAFITDRIARLLS